VNHTALAYALKPHSER